MAMSSEDIERLRNIEKLKILESSYDILKPDYLEKYSALIRLIYPKTEGKPYSDPLPWPDPVPWPEESAVPQWEEGINSMAMSIEELEYRKSCESYEKQFQKDSINQVSLNEQSVKAHEKLNREHLYEQTLRIQIDEARKLEYELYREYRTPKYEQHNVAWFGNPEILESYLSPMREAVSIERHRAFEARCRKFALEAEEKRKFEEARRLEHELHGGNSTPPWGQHNREWWNNPQNVDGYLADLRNQLQIKNQEIRAAQEIQSSSESPLIVEDSLESLRLRLQVVEQQLLETEGIYKERVRMGRQMEHSADTPGFDNYCLQRERLNAREDSLIRNIETGIQARNVNRNL